MNQLNIFNEFTYVKDMDWKNIERLIKADNCTLALQMLVGFGMPLRLILMKVINYRFIPFIDGWDEFEDNGRHPFCRFTLHGHLFEFYEDISGQGVELDIDKHEMGTVMWIGENDKFDSRLKSKMIRDFILFISERWQVISKQIGA